MCYHAVEEFGFVVALVRALQGRDFPQHQGEGVNVYRFVVRAVGGHLMDRLFLSLVSYSEARKAEGEMKASENASDTTLERAKETNGKRAEYQSNIIGIQEREKKEEVDRELRQSEES